MARVVSLRAPKIVEVAERRDAVLKPGEVRLRTLYSGISAGTELTIYRGTNPYLAKRWDKTRRLFVSGGVPKRYPVEDWGYEEVGEVVELGPKAAGPAIGTLVRGTWGHRSTAVVRADWAAERALEPGVEPLHGIFSRIGAIALNAVLDADIHLGETVAVFGLGVPGQIAAQLARLNGGSVVAVDGVDRRLELARRLGADHVLDLREGSPAERIKALTLGRGADVAIEFTGAYRGLHEAIRSVAYSSRIVSAGFYQGEGAGLALGEEFHHNRVEIVCSQISGVSPRLDHRWDRPRLERTVMGLAAAGRLDLGALVSHVVPLEEAAAAYRLLDENPADAVQVVLDFQGAA